MCAINAIHHTVQDVKGNFVSTGQQRAKSSRIYRNQHKQGRIYQQRLHGYAEFTRMNGINRD